MPVATGKKFPSQRDPAPSRLRIIRRATSRTQLAPGRRSARKAVGRVSDRIKALLGCRLSPRTPRLHAVINGSVFGWLRTVDQVLRVDPRGCEIAALRREAQRSLAPEDSTLTPPEWRPIESRPALDRCRHPQSGCARSGRLPSRSLSCGVSAAQTCRLVLSHQNSL